MERTRLPAASLDGPGPVHHVLPAASLRPQREMPAMSAHPGASRDKSAQRAMHEALRDDKREAGATALGQPGTNHVESPATASPWQDVTGAGCPVPPVSQQLGRQPGEQEVGTSLKRKKGSVQTLAPPPPSCLVLEKSPDLFEISPPWSENILCMALILLNVLQSILQSRMQSIWMNFPCVFHCRRVECSVNAD